MANTGPQRHFDTDMMDLDSVPLFMRDLPTEDSATSVAYDALQSLVYDGTPDEQAQSFKKQGNDYFKGKKYREAAGFYSQGIDVKPEDPVLREALLLNRALCNLELKNFGSVLRDTSAALSFNPKSPKAYYRASCALEALGRYAESVDVCLRCLAFDPDNTSVNEQYQKVLKVKQVADAKEAEKTERLRKETQEKRVMNACFQSLSLVIVNTGMPNPHAQWAPHFDPNFSGFRTSATPVLFPVFLLYPQYSTSDLITSFDPSATFAYHLSTMFPPTPGMPVSPSGASPNHPTAPNWDLTGEYTSGNLSVYATTTRHRILKVGKRMTLRDACDAAARVPHGSPRDGLELKDGAMSFSVVPKGEWEKVWVEEMKRKQAAGALG
ncbi:hypothetical protein FRB94_000309 [Tulasnella sp. JGI-2019a]|nr:hypothetical protein FRB93_003202 [Tulasnella sp. JGI-2019a]KAG9006898.1 hypothetical protein FRB94_000309 [Tulasnella sp. JGI-2019a]KAG9032207.1 hypothetical protein FRB95_001686 [Tulasnella sp. JGI-2019a]